jgi:hypothetical protein
MVHAALLLLMLEAVTKDLVFTISLKRSTQNLQLSTSWAGRLHHLPGENRKLSADGQNDAFDPDETFPYCLFHWRSRFKAYQSARIARYDAITLGMRA